MSFTQQLAEWESKIRSGLGSEVARDVKLIDPSEVASRFLPQLANLARRCGEYRTAFSLLNAEFLEAREKPLENEALIAEYAATLTEVGATAFSERLLGLFETPRYEMTPFYRALLWMKKWEYEKVPAEIELFKTLSQDEYRLRIADVNLLSALITLKDWKDASALIADLRQSTSLPAMFIGVLDEQEGELLYLTGRKDEGRALFQRSLDHLRKSGSSSAIYSEKWLVIADLLEKPWSDVEPHWTDFFEQARAKGYWEVLRELNRLYATHFQKHDLLAKVYFGTPLEGYRARVMNESGFEPPESFFYPAVTDAKCVFDTHSLELTLNGERVKLSKNNRMILRALTRDLFRPIAVGSLFEAIYPDDYFHPDFAKKRVYQNIARFREFADELKLPLEIESSPLGFYLAPGPGFAIRYSNEASETTALPDMLALARHHFGGNEFTASDLADLTGVSKRTINRALAGELTSGPLIAIGAGRNRKYRIE